MSEDNRTYKIKIEFAESPQNGATATGADTNVPTPNEALPKDNGDANKQQAAKHSKSEANPAKAMLKQMAGKVASTALNNYGHLTGDYITQQNIQAVVSEATALGAAVALGPTGIALYATDKLLQAYNYHGDMMRSKRDSAFQRERVYASTDRS